MNAVVLGANGYLGSRIIQNVSSLGYANITGVTRLALMSEKAVKGPSITYLKYSEVDDVAAALGAADVIIHAAGPNATFSAAYPTQAMAECISLARNITSSVSITRQPLIIYFSTVHVYSQSLCGEIDERTEAKNTHPYALSRRLTEDIFLDHGARNKIRPIILRLGNIFGSPFGVISEGWKLAPNQFCLQAMIRKRIVLTNPKNPLRHYTPISLLLSFITEAMYHGRLFPNLLNLVGSKAMSVKELAEIVASEGERILLEKVRVDHRLVQSDSSFQPLHIKSIHREIMRYDSELLSREIRDTLLYIKRKIEDLGTDQFRSYLEVET